MKKKILVALTALAMAVSLVACKEETIPVTDVVGMNAEEARSVLADAGFENVILDADSSGKSNMILDASNWTVIAQSPEADSQETKDAEITLSCRKTDEIVKDELNQVINLAIPDAKEKLTELGYTISYFHQNSGLDMTTDISAAYTDDDLTNWTVTDIKSFNANDKTIELIINTNENIAANAAASATRETLENKLSAGAAWDVTEAYGKSQYSYGFKLHYIMGKLAEEAVDENTWFLKASCTVTNEYNAKLEATCEATVTGTSDNPQITNFIVY